MSRQQSSVEDLTEKLRRTKLEEAPTRRSTRDKKVRFVPGAIPWQVYTPNHYMHDLAKKCRDPENCRFRRCKEMKKQADDNRENSLRKVRKEKKMKAKKIVKKAVKTTITIKKIRKLEPPSANIVKCLRFLINRSLKRKIKTHSGRFGTQSKIRIELPLSITQFNCLFVHKLKMPVRNIRKFSMTVAELTKLIGPDWVKCVTHDTGTQVRIAGVISVNFRAKKSLIYKSTKCPR